jgi:hypothetical protein
MTLKQKLLAIKQSNSIHPVQLDLVEWMLSCEYVTASRKKKGWGLYGPTYMGWNEYIL